MTKWVLVLHPLDVCQSLEALPHLNSPQQPVFSLQYGKYQVGFMNVKVAGFFGFIVLRLKLERFMGKTDV